MLICNFFQAGSHAACMQSLTMAVSDGDWPCSQGGTAIIVSGGASNVSCSVHARITVASRAVDWVQHFKHLRSLATITACKPSVNASEGVHNSSMHVQQEHLSQKPSEYAP